MDITTDNLAGVNTGFRAAYNTGRESAATFHRELVTIIPSTTAQNSYPFLGEMAGIREFIDERFVHKLEKYDYSIKNKKFELTYGIERDTFEDDQYGILTPFFQGWGDQSAKFPDTQVSKLISTGFSTACYDGQNMFDTDHPGYNENGEIVSVSNYQAGTGPAWYLLDLSRPLRPFIYQERKAFEFAALFDINNPEVFKSDAFQYGIRGRSNVGHGFWQQVQASKAALDATNYQLLTEQMEGVNRKDGDPAGFTPTHLLCGSKNKAAAKKLLKAMTVDGGDSNINHEDVQLIVTPWLR